MTVAVNGANQCPKEQEYDWDIEMLLAHEDCDKFYKCTYGQPVEKLCPNDLFFNIELGQCDWRANVDCGDRNIPDDNDSNGQGGGSDQGGSGGDSSADGDDGDGGTGGSGNSSESVESCEDIPIAKPDFEVYDNGCPVNATIHWLLPNETNCAGFFYCVSGQLYPMDCPNGLHFNRRLQVSDSRKTLLLYGML